jgi:hypothetical protein
LAARSEAHLLYVTEEKAFGSNALSQGPHYSRGRREEKAALFRKI